MTKLSLDICRCMGETPVCPQRDNCARHRSIPIGVDLFWSRNLNAEGLEDCLHFIPYHQAD
jgi:hypothetical protein